MYVLGNNFLLMHVLVTAAASVANIASSTTHTQDTTSGKIYLQYLLNFTETSINVRRVMEEGWSLCYVWILPY